ncbi:MAG: hypothetical protein ACP5NF_11990 [Thermoanaerobaculum sp.]
MRTGGEVGEPVADALEELRKKQKSLTYRELQNILKRAGCRVRETKEGCRVSHAQALGFIVFVPRPHHPGGRKDVKQPYVKKCIELLEIVLEQGEVRHDEEKP